MVRGMSQDAFSEMVILSRRKGCLVRWGGTYGAVRGNACAAFHDSGRVTCRASSGGLRLGAGLVTLRAMGVVCDTPGPELPFGYVTAMVCFEPNLCIWFSRCVRAQQDNRRNRIVLIAAVQRENLPLIRSAMISIARILRS